jgi:hypothetical protein
VALVRWLWCVGWHRAAALSGGRRAVKFEVHSYLMPADFDLLTISWVR